MCDISKQTLFENKNILPSSAKTSTWFSLSINWNDMFPSHNTAVSIENTCSWSSLLIRTISRALWRSEKTTKQGGATLVSVWGSNELEKRCFYFTNGESNSYRFLTMSLQKFWVSSVPSTTKQPLCLRYLYSLAILRFSLSAKRSVEWQEKYLNKIMFVLECKACYFNGSNSIKKNKPFLQN